MVEARPGQLARAQGGHQGVAVVQPGPGRVQEETPWRIAANWSAPIMPAVSAVTGACIETTSDLARSSPKWRGPGGVGVAGHDPHPHPCEAPL